MFQWHNKDWAWISLMSFWKSYFLVAISLQAAYNTRRFFGRWIEEIFQYILVSFYFGIWSFCTVCILCFHPFWKQVTRWDWHYSTPPSVHCKPVQGQNRVFPVKFSTQGKTCFLYREPLFSLQGPLFSVQGFPCEKILQGKPCFHYREWVCSVCIHANVFISNLQV